MEEASDINKFRLKIGRPGLVKDGFGFFRGIGITDYERTFKMWLREFPRPIFLVASMDHTILGWVYIEDWGAPSLGGEPVFVLRAIETLPSMRTHRIGSKLVLAGLEQTMGYMLTKPLTPLAEKFFRRLGFKAPNEFHKCPIDLSQHHGYLILPPFRRKKILETINQYFPGQPVPKR